MGATLDVLFIGGNFGHSLGNDAQCCALYITHRSLASVQYYLHVRSYPHLPYKYVINYRCAVKLSSVSTWLYELKRKYN